MRAEARDDWLGWGGNPRRSDLTWRRSPLPRGHELSLTAGVIVLFPGPLTQVKQRRRVRRVNRNRVWLVFTHTTQLITYFLSSLAITSVPPLFIIHMRVYDQYCSTYVCVCGLGALPSYAVCIHSVLPSHSFVFLLTWVWISSFRLMEWLYFHSALYIHVVWFLCVSASSLSAYAFHNPSLYTVLFRLQLPIVRRLNRSVVTAEKPDTLRLDVCIMFICAVVVYPSFHLSTSFRLLLPVT